MDLTLLNTTQAHLKYTRPPEVTKYSLPEAAEDEERRNNDTQQHNCNDRHKNPANTQRRYNVAATSTLQRRCNDVDATLCVCWEEEPCRKKNYGTA